MAAQMSCDMCDSEPAAMMQTNLATGDTLTVGQSCLLAFYLTVAQTVIGEMPAGAVAEYADAIKPVIDALTESFNSAGVSLVLDENPATGDMEYVNADTGEPAAPVVRAGKPRAKPAAAAGKDDASV